MSYQEWEKGSLQKIADELSDKHPIDIIQWAVDQFAPKDITLACSFGFEDVALVDVIQRVNPDIPIFYLDTDLLFPETYQVHERLASKYEVRFHRVAASISLSEQTEAYGDQLWGQDPHLCCRLRKVEPLRNHLRHYRGWITGIRREQSPTRAHSEVVEWDDAFGLVKVNPLAFWTEQQVWSYIHKHEIPYNPLHDRGYPSIGCWPCTRSVKRGEDSRSGRWSGLDKTECGLHNSPVKSASRLDQVE